jgi:cytochrome P450
VLEALRDPFGLFFRGTQRHGEIVHFRFLRIHYVLLDEPEAIRHVLVENAKAYVKSRNYVGLRTILGNGLLTSEGELWRHQRKLAQPAFHREHLGGFLATMVRCTRDMLDRWERELGDRTFDAHAEMTRLAFRIAGLTLLSAELDGEAKAMGDALTIGLHWANAHAEALVKLPPTWPTPANVRMQRAVGAFDALIYRIIDEREREGPKPDLLSMLLDAKDEVTGERMDRKQLRDELITLIAAGHETTANALSFAFYLLSKHPEAWRLIVDEVSGVLGDRPMELSDLPRLPYVQRVVQEALRLYPPVWIFERDALEEDTAGPYRIPKGSIVGVCPFVLHRNPRYWDNPEGFDPDRFLPENEKLRPRYAYLPFGGGPRTCIGNQFALMEMAVVLATVAHAR